MKIVFFLFFASPFIILFFFNPETTPVDPSLFREAVVNTSLLAFFVVLFSVFTGVGFSLLNLLYDYPLKRFLNKMMILPMGFPPYVLAFIYLGLKLDFPEQIPFEFQGELWFLIFILVLSLTPYIYLFCNLGLKRLDQSLVETEQILGAGFYPFFKSALFPQMIPYLISAVFLVLFESLGDFGSASIINTPVITTLIYKLWFDLFSFPGAVALCLKYSIFIFVFIFIEFFFKQRLLFPREKSRKPIEGKSPGLFWKWVITGGFLIYGGLAFLIPLSQLIIWSFTEGGDWTEVITSLQNSLVLGVITASLCVLVSVLFAFLFHLLGRCPGDYLPLTSVGYSLPGTLLAVSAYSILLFLAGELGFWLLTLSLIMALFYKFFTVSFRLVGEAVEDFPKELGEVSQLFSVSLFKRFYHGFFPEIKKAVALGFLLVMIEVIKEMPLTLMLSPGNYQTLSTRVYNLTSEGLWEQASHPSLFLVIIGFMSVLGTQGLQIFDSR